MAQRHLLPWILGINGNAEVIYQGQTSIQVPFKIRQGIEAYILIVLGAMISSASFFAFFRGHHHPKWIGVAVFFIVWSFSRFQNIPKSVHISADRLNILLTSGRSVSTQVNPSIKISPESIIWKIGRTTYKITKNNCNRFQEFKTELESSLATTGSVRSTAGYQTRNEHTKSQYRTILIWITITLVLFANLDVSPSSPTHYIIRQIIVSITLISVAIVIDRTIIKNKKSTTGKMDL